MTDQEIEALRAFAADYEDHDAIGCVTSHAILRLLEERRRLLTALRAAIQEPGYSGYTGWLPEAKSAAAYAEEPAHE